VVVGSEASNGQSGDTWRVFSHVKLDGMLFLNDCRML